MPPRRPPPPPPPPPPVRPPRDLPPLGQLSIRFVLMGMADDETDEGDDGMGWDEVDVKERVGFEKEEEDTKVDGEETNLVVKEEEEGEEMGNEENVFVTTGADDDTMVGDRKDDDDDDDDVGIGKDDDCVNVVVVLEEGDVNEVAGDRLAKNLAPLRGDTDSPATATARSVTKQSLILFDLRVQCRVDIVGRNYGDLSSS